MAATPAAAAVVCCWLRSDGMRSVIGRQQSLSADWRLLYVVSSVAGMSTRLADQVVARLQRPRRSKQPAVVRRARDLAAVLALARIPFCVEWYDRAGHTAFVQQQQRKKEGEGEEDRTEKANTPVSVSHHFKE